jgi:hypothetical protein
MGEKGWSGCSCLERTAGPKVDTETTGRGDNNRSGSILRSRRDVSCRPRPALTIARLGRERRFVTQTCVERDGSKETVMRCLCISVLRIITRWVSTSIVSAPGR